VRDEAALELGQVHVGRKARAAGRWADAETALKFPSSARMTAVQRAEVVGGERFQTFDVAKGQKHLVSLQLSRAPEPAARPKESAPEKQKATSAARAPEASAAASSYERTDLFNLGVSFAVGTAVGSGAFLILGEITREDRQERSAELVREGYPPDTCRPPGGAPVCSALRRMREKEVLFNEIGLATLAVSGGLGVATVVSFVLAPKKASSDTVRVAPLVTGQAAGLSILGVL
jgi:hypothetical protein